MQKMIKYIYLLIFISIIYSSILRSQSFTIFGNVGAIKYTIGPYQYVVNVSVLIFFGLVTLMELFIYLLIYFEYDLFLPAASVGLLSMEVLNLNNRYKK
ncbi:MAG TPA: hypothetical protein VF849_01000 [Blattabacteriaceae bacterium]